MRILVIPFTLLFFITGCATTSNPVTASNSGQADVSNEIVDDGPTNADEQYALAGMFLKDTTVTNHYKHAVSWYRKAAMQNHGGAQSMLGMMYYFGNGVERDYNSAAYWNKLGAEKGNSFASIFLGIQYYKGLGVEQNYKTAISWLEKGAATEGVFRDEAHRWLGNAYYFGKGYPQNFAKARDYYMKAAYVGNGWSAIMLGIMSVKGQSIERSALLCYANLNYGLSRLNDVEQNEATVKLRDKCAAKLSSSEIQEAQELSRKMASIADNSE